MAAYGEAMAHYQNATGQPLPGALSICCRWRYDFGNPVEETVATPVQVEAQKARLKPKVEQARDPISSLFKVGAGFGMIRYSEHGDCNRYIRYSCRCRPDENESLG